MFHQRTLKARITRGVLASALMLGLGAMQRAMADDGDATCCGVTGRAGALTGAIAQATDASRTKDASPSDSPSKKPADKADRPPSMMWIPGGEFSMGSTDSLARPDEKPVHRVRVDGFWMDETEVTNAQFAQFIKATGYVTVAQRPVDWEELKKQVPPGTPKPDEKMLQPGSLVFTPPDHAVDLRRHEQWWSWKTGANWLQPQGPGSSIEGKDNEPVVHVSYEDALAYCMWAGKQLPTEAMWEFAARGGLDGRVNGWGDEPIDAKRANTWQGSFPFKNTSEDGFARVASVKQFPANGYGLYDMAGNVWEWCSDLYRPDTYARQILTSGKGVVIDNPAGPDRSLDPRNPDAPESRVHRGGSFLCCDSYCASYRPSARMAAPPDTGTEHLGFRCVMTAEAWRKRQSNVGFSSTQSADAPAAR